MLTLVLCVFSPPLCLNMLALKLMPWWKPHFTTLNGKQLHTSSLVIMLANHFFHSYSASHGCFLSQQRCACTYRIIKLNVGTKQRTEAFKLPWKPGYDTVPSDWKNGVAVSIENNMFAIIPCLWIRWMSLPKYTYTYKLIFHKGLICVKLPCTK